MTADEAVATLQAMRRLIHQHMTIIIRREPGVKLGYVVGVDGLTPIFLDDGVNCRRFVYEGYDETLA